MECNQIQSPSSICGMMAIEEGRLGLSEGRLGIARNLWPGVNFIDKIMKANPFYFQYQKSAKNQL